VSRNDGFNTVVALTTEPYAAGLQNVIKTKLSSAVASNNAVQEIA